MKTWAPIQYRDFWDVPRIFFFANLGNWFLFDCPFDEETEDYGQHYRVYLIPEPPKEDLQGSWSSLPKTAMQYLGELPVSRVEFDSTRRNAINLEVMDELTLTRRAV